MKKKTVKPTLFVATVTYYRKEATGYVGYWTKIETTCSKKGMETRKRNRELDSDEWVGVKEWRIHDRMYTREEVEELKAKLED